MTDPEYPESGETVADSSREARQWAMFLHFSLFAGYLVPFAGLIVPIVIWQLKKEEFPELDDHAYEVFNWMISALIYAVLSFILTFVLIGILGFIALAIAGVVFPIIGGIKANEGILWRYPATIRFLN